ncbi:MAG: hypothetical protein MnENMB40S_15570 [Rhizobiaceae bacterium MnEN-MB40S]|nr:MAG: hypothetical protein MnENMB40S_15570 [Rhizobiaceae bacterium MnEN-MB40S]
MTGVILVCRMSSSRLPGKTLMDFGGQPLLAHIVARIEKAGVERSRIVVCTSTSDDDAAIVDAAASLGCKHYAGSLDNVSKRILGAADAYGYEDFLLILGDNVWIDPRQIGSVLEKTESSAFDYIVTATPELAFRPDSEPFYPIGTRIQYIRTAFMKGRLTELDNEEVQEHASKLFSCLPAGTRYTTIYTQDGLSKPVVGDLNISINTRDDYDLALAALDHVGDPLAPTTAVTEFYLNDRSLNQEY